jgi:hypothetical protein
MTGQDLQRLEILRIMAMAEAASHFPGFTKWVFACAHLGVTSTSGIKPAKYVRRSFGRPAEWVGSRTRRELAGWATMQGAS